MISNFLLLAVCLIAGAVFRRLKAFPKETPAALNGYVLFLALPAMIIAEVHDIPIGKESVIPALMAWLLFGLSFLIFGYVGKMWRSNPKVIGTLILTAGLGNTSFLGYPMLEALYGHEALKTGILVDQLGSFLVLSTLGVGVASFYSKKDMSHRSIIKRMFSFPLIYTLILAFVLRPFPMPPGIKELLLKLGSTIAPVALVSVGFQLHLSGKILKAYSFPLISGLTYKLLLGPAALALIYVALLEQSGLPVQVTLVESAMAPMITAAILASEYELDSELSGLMVGLGVPISFITIPLWAYLLRGV